MTNQATTTKEALQPQDMTDDELKAAISFHEAEAHKFKCEAAKIWRLRVRMDGGIAVDKQMLADLHARRAARVSAPIVAPEVNHEARETAAQIVARYYPDDDELETAIREALLESQRSGGDGLLSSEVAWKIALHIKGNNSDYYGTREGLAELESIINRHFVAVAAPASTVAPQQSQLSPIGYERVITVEWETHNARRHELIEAKRSRLLSETEITELAELQWLAGIKRALADGPVAVRDEAESEFGDAFVKAVAAIKSISLDRRATALSMLYRYFDIANTPPSTLDAPPTFKNTKEAVLYAQRHGIPTVIPVTPPSTRAKAAAEEILSKFPELKEHDKWVTLGRVKIDIETETETFERATAPSLPVLDQIAAIIERCFGG